MARYPTFEEYQRSGRYGDGLKKVNDFLKRHPTDVQLLTVKLQLLVALKQDHNAVLDQLLVVTPPISDLQELLIIEEAVITSQHDEWPIPKTAGPQVNKLWDAAAKATTSMNHKLDILSLRFSRAILTNRLADAQQALIQLKVLQPKNRVAYFAHAAVTQLLSSSKDDMQARLALGLARKAVKENFDADANLDCRVPGQIFAVHEVEDLEQVVGGKFGESKQVYDAVRRRRKDGTNGSTSESTRENVKTDASTEPLLEKVDQRKAAFKALIESNFSVDEVLAFASQSVRLFHDACQTIKEDRRRIKVDACFVAISALVRAFEKTNDSTYLLHSAYLAETLLRQDEHIHEARLILVYLYMRLGLGSLALQMFELLRIKEIQHDTVGHALFTHISLIHPFSTGATKKDTIDPFKMASRTLEVYTRCEEKLSESEAGVLAHGQTGMIFDLHELRESLRSSLTRRIIHLEQRRLDRLVYSGFGQDVAELGPKATANWTDVVDNRDFAATFDYGYNVEKVLHGHGSLEADRRRLLFGLAADAAWCLACGQKSPVDDPDKLLDAINAVDSDASRLAISTDGANSEKTKTAELVDSVTRATFKMLVAHRSADTESIKSDAPALVSAMEKMDAATTSLQASTTGAFNSGFMSSYANIDVLKIVIKACGMMAKKSSEHSDTIKQVKEKAEQAFNGIQKHAQEQAKTVSAKSVRSSMERQTAVFEAVALFDNGLLDSFCDAVAASAKEGWEGVGKIKVS